MELTLDVIGGEWKPLILWYLREDTLRFSELGRKLSPVTQKMLTQQPKVKYSLTDAGKSLLPILETMSQCGLNYAQTNDLQTEKV